VGPSPTAAAATAAPPPPQSKARLGAVVHQKTAAAIALTDAMGVDQPELGKVRAPPEVGGWAAGAG
jgi:hypothetical protein